MVTCNQLMGLDIFRNVRLVAGRKGLNRAISWVYAKHTKTITPWVQGGEFLLVSGYEHEFDEAELLQLVEEAFMNDLSGILVEGGINFKGISENVVNKANEKEIPLFFVKGVISFLDVTREISDFILENRYLTKKNTSILDQVLNSSSLSHEEKRQLFYSLGIPVNSYFLLGVFSISENQQINDQTMERADMMIGFSRKLQKHTGALFDKLKLKELCKVNLESVDYLIYADNEENLMEIADSLKKINASLNLEQDDCDIFLTFSSVMNDGMNILSGLNEAYFTRTLLRKKLFPEMVKSFSDIGSYRMMFYVEDNRKMVLLRNQYLKKLYETDLEGSSQLLETLREYLIQGGNILQTSKNLFIHRNTLQYRLEKIEAITMMDINEFNIKRDFFNAFMILDMFPFE
ncbi:PucR C-terminal helix-turn-helix domain-containing protein [Dethiosulfatibacter aminovorans DSM 17477]|uniref:PucR C-terminal helix-turn-helix domain-containing protein n=1 Tax=Dethiosulfatibacter aminovorans DSM 17477 TaxID=1121476 RepID=A0A1M6MQB5_9FIRM|nr:PucR family transcriptional regulator ligand-binding domain-containing protein [Dethiosulfatibacter aminovorans]SHJ85688.1 PucR C-terminal helix-turn-helix domain-containing protein [Dethiosulfatibacter aminovorans DSM 17477]